MEGSVEGDTDVPLPMNVTVLRNSDNLVNPKSGIWREDKVFMTCGSNRSLRMFARIPREVEVIVHLELLGKAMFTAQCMHV
jgi:hypothetical protein